MTWIAVAAWMGGHRKASAFGSVAIVAAIIGAAFAACHRAPNPIPAKEQATIDVLKATKPAFDSSQLATQLRANTTLTTLVVDSTALLAARRDAAHWKAIADSASAVAKSRDASVSTKQNPTQAAAPGPGPGSAAAPPSIQIDTTWKLVAEARTKEAADLQTVVDSQAKDLTAAHATILDLRAAAAAALSRVNISESPTTGLNDRLAHDVQTAGQCRALLVFGCLSRKASFAVGVVGTVAVGAVVHYHKQLGIP